MNSNPYSITFIDGALAGYSLDVASVNGDTVTFKSQWPTINGVVTRPAVNDRYFITAVNLNLRVNEATQVDTLNLWNANSPIDEHLVISSDRITGLGMGPDTIIGGTAFGGGITYSGLESLSVHLGTGNNTVEINSTHSGDTNIYGSTGNDSFSIRTLSGHTSISAGTGSDSVIVSDTPQTIDRITALLSVAADGINDTLLIDDSGDDTDNNAVVTDRSVTGLDMPSVAEVQTVKVQATGGTFRLGRADNTDYVQLNYGVTAGTLTTALLTLYGAAAGDILVDRVVDGDGWLYTVTFAGHLAGTNVASLIWAETPENSGLTSSDTVSKDVRINTRVEGSTAPTRSTVQTVTVSATDGTLRLQLLNQTIAINYSNGSPAPLTQLRQQLNQILNPNNSVSSLPHTNNFEVRQFGNTFEILFRGEHFGTQISSIDTSILTGSAVLETRKSGINYYGFSEITMNLGGGADSLLVASTIQNSVYRINTGAGNDVIRISSTQGLTDGNLNQHQGDLYLDAQVGSNTLYVSDVSDVTGDTVSLSRTANANTEELLLTGLSRQTSSSLPPEATLMADSCSPAEAATTTGRSMRRS